MMNDLFKSLLALGCLALVLVPGTGQAQKVATDGPSTSQCMGLSVSTNSSTIHPGDGVGVFAVVSNCSTSKARISVDFSALAPCGVEYSLGYNRIALNPGQSIMVTTVFNVPPASCLGVYSVSVNATSGKNAPSSTATTYVTVQ
jgi:hypothetical protein